MLSFESSLSRILSYLEEDLDLITKIDNPFTDDERKTLFVKLSRKGKEFQTHLIGSTRVYQPNVSELRNVVNINRKGVK